MKLLLTVLYYLIDLFHWSKKTCFFILKACKNKFLHTFSNKYNGIATSLLLILYYNAHAQVITDGSMGVIKHLSGNMLISQDLGTKAGNNLFHSFNTFNIDKGESVIFTSVDSFKNVISRVTGGKISHINGLLKSNIAGANFYFINPAGIFFDKNARVDVPAAFHISTSDSLTFKDNTVFNLETKTSSLSIAEPTDFGFLNDKSSDIKITDATLEFDKGNDILLNAKNIILNNAILKNSLGNLSFYAKENLSLTHKSYIETIKQSSNNSSDIRIASSNIILNNSYIGSYTYSKAPSGMIILKANNIETNQGNITSFSFGDGDTGKVIVQAENIAIDAGGDNQILDGKGKIIIENIAGIGNMVFANGNADDVSIHTNTVIIKNGGGMGSFTFGQGNAANVTLNSDIIIAENKGTIGSNSYGLGNAGIVTITSKNIMLNNGGDIGSTAYSLGNAKIVNIKSNNLQINGGRIGTETYKTGNAGIININVDNLILSKGGIISSSTYGKGNAGTINISSKQLTLDNAHIYSDAYDMGNAGQITLALTNKLKASHSVISTQAEQANGGNISIDGKILILNNGTTIDTYTKQTETGKAKNGEIQLNADVLFMNNAQIRTEANNPKNGGNITLALKAVIPSYNQLSLNNKPVVNSETNGNSINAVKAIGHVILTSPQLNVSNSIMGFSNNIIIEKPDINKGACNSESMSNSSLKRMGKGNIPTNEMKLVYIPLATLSTTAQLQSMITPNLVNANLIIENSPCISLI